MTATCFELTQRMSLPTNRATQKNVGKINIVFKPFESKLNIFVVEKTNTISTIPFDVYLKGLSSNKILVGQSNTTIYMEAPSVIISKRPLKRPHLSKASHF